MPSAAIVRKYMRALNPNFGLGGFNTQGGNVAPPIAKTTTGLVNGGTVTTVKFLNPNTGQYVPTTVITSPVHGPDVVTPVITPAQLNTFTQPANPNSIPDREAAIAAGNKAKADADAKAAALVAAEKAKSDKALADAKEQARQDKINADIKSRIDDENIKRKAQADRDEAAAKAKAIIDAADAARAPKPATTTAIYYGPGGGGGGGNSSEPAALPGASLFDRFMAAPFALQAAVVSGLAFGGWTIFKALTGPRQAGFGGYYAPAPVYAQNPRKRRRTKAFNFGRFYAKNPGVAPAGISRVPREYDDDLAGAQEFFNDFHWGKDAKKVKIVKVPKAPKVAVKLGELVNVTYKTKKGKDPETYYQHEFGEEGGKRPSLAADPKSKKLFIVGGDYTITADGIKD